MSDTIQIGQLARRAGVSVQTVRYYERRGLLPEPPRTASRYRVYPEEALTRLRFIRRAKELGFTLTETEELLSLRAEPGASCAEVLARANEKIARIERKIADLEAMRQALLALADQCRGNATPTRCPILRALEDEVER
ncbi:MAG: heavy metal-responsive transcriptional regulator [Planctomycetota bacterium]|nr:MAG: heavy metal-responsive transcriptional regulator [Planctomycetota bacterium]